MNNENNFKEFNELFRKIKGNLYRCRFNDTGGAGKTFEYIINKKLDTKSLPDYKNIEIKVLLDSSKYPLRLFNLSPKLKANIKKEAIYFLIDYYGYKGTDGSANFNSTFNAKQIKIFKDGTKFKLVIDYENENLILKIINTDNTIFNYVYWDFSSIIQKLEDKLKYLVVINAKYSIIDNIKYYNYYNSNNYVLKNFYCFLKAIEDGFIDISISIKQLLNKTYYYGCKFEINLDNLYKIYDKSKF